MKISEDTKNSLAHLIVGLVFGTIGSLIFNLIKMFLDADKNNHRPFFLLMIGLVIGTLTFLMFEVVFKNNTDVNNLITTNIGIGISIALMAGLFVNNYYFLGFGFSYTVISMNVYCFNKALTKLKPK